MSPFDSLLNSVRRVILMESKLQDLSDGLREVSGRVMDHEGRLIRIETMIEMAQGQAGSPAKGDDLMASLRPIIGLPPALVAAQL